MAKPDYSTWLTKQQAAEAIGCSTKTVEKLAAGKQLQHAYWRRPETGARAVVYHPDDVARLRTERNPEAGPFVLPPVETNRQAAMTLHGGVDAARQFMELLAAATSQNSQTRPRVELRHKYFLTVREASELAGLPATEIRRLVATEKLEALKTGAGWRIRRAALEKL